MSGGLPPFTAVSTFCSVSSLLTNSVLTFCPGAALVLGDQLGERLGLRPGVALPDLDRAPSRTPTTRRRCVRAAAREGHRRRRERGEQPARGPATMPCDGHAALRSTMLSARSLN